MPAALLLGRIERRRASRIRCRQADRADQEAEQDDAGDDQRRDVDRTVLPQLAPHRPVQRAAACGRGGGIGLRRRAASRARRSTVCSSGRSFVPGRLCCPSRRRTGRRCWACARRRARRVARGRRRRTAGCCGRTPGARASAAAPARRRAAPDAPSLRDSATRIPPCCTRARCGRGR